jgi:hypothetical protein
MLNDSGKPTGSHRPEHWLCPTGTVALTHRNGGSHTPDPRLQRGGIFTMESFWGMLKSEMYYLRRFTDRDELIRAIENYIDFYNNGRFQKRLHCMTPMEFHYAYAA